MAKDHFNFWKESHEGFSREWHALFRYHTFLIWQKKKKNDYHHVCDLRPFCVGDYRADLESARVPENLASGPSPSLIMCFGTSSGTASH